MACGTGKTYTALNVVEQETNKNGFILFLVPSIALLSQTLKSWLNDTTGIIYPVCICSDTSSSKVKILIQMILLLLIYHFQLLQM